MGGSINMNGKIEDNGINQNTKVTLPIYLQIIILISVISFTATAVLGYAFQIGKDEKHDEKIKVLEDGKLDKSTYDKDRSNDKIMQDLNSRKLDAIMKKLKIDNY